MRLEAGQVAVITGGASGIGAALAHSLAQRGLRVVLADIEADALAATREQILATRPDAQLMVSAIDVTDATAMDELARQVHADFGRVDLIANNAGVVGPRLPVWEQRIEDYEWVLRVNLWGVVNGLRAFVPYLVRAGSGHVLNTASIAALTTITGGGNGPYGASKHAVAGLSDVLREELSSAAPDVGVTVLCPGPVATRIREAGRNRPAELDPGDVNLSDATLPRFEHRVETITADEAAACAIAAIEANRFWALTNPGNESEVRATVDALLADIVAARAIP